MFYEKFVLLNALLARGTKTMDKWRNRLHRTFIVMCYWYHVKSEFFRCELWNVVI